MLKLNKHIVVPSTSRQQIDAPFINIKLNYFFHFDLITNLLIKIVLWKQCCHGINITFFRRHLIWKHDTIYFKGLMIHQFYRLGMQSGKAPLKSIGTPKIATYVFRYFCQHHSRAWMTYRLDEYASFPVLPNLLFTRHPTLTLHGLTFWNSPKNKPQRIEYKSCHLLSTQSVLPSITEYAVLKRRTASFETELFITVYGGFVCRRPSVVMSLLT